MNNIVNGPFSTSCSSFTQNTPATVDDDDDGDDDDDDDLSYGEELYQL